jgi:ribosomal protein S18 acetylase RimI-like enzyme
VAPPVVIEPAVPADAAALLALHRRVLAEGAWFVTEPDELRDDLATKHALVRDVGRLGNGALLVARAGPRVVGSGQVAGGSLRRVRHVGRVELMVDAEWRGLGVGRALLAELVAWARQNAVLKRLTLQVYADNERARALYRAAGFVEEGVRPREYRFPDGTFRDEVAMGMWLGPAG